MNFRIILFFMVDIISADDVNVIQRSNCLCFSMKAGEIGGVIHPFRGEYLDGTATSHQHMFRQVNRTHATFADQIQQPVFTQEKTFVFALQQFVGLPACQQRPPDQFLGDLSGFSQLHPFFLIFGEQLLQLIDRDQTTLFYQV